MYIRTLSSITVYGVPLELLPPNEEVNGIHCEPPDCSLHLHMDTTDYARLGVYSTDSAPGIIVAHGRHTFRVRIVGLCVWLLTDYVYACRPKVCLGQKVYT